jgi:hypothetical protein
MPAEAVGTSGEFLAQPGLFPQATEVSEPIISWLKQTRFKATVRYREAAVLPVGSFRGWAVSTLFGRGPADPDGRLPPGLTLRWCQPTGKAAA